MRRKKVVGDTDSAVCCHEEDDDDDSGCGDYCGSEMQFCFRRASGCTIIKRKNVSLILTAETIRNRFVFKR